MGPGLSPDDLEYLRRLASERVLVAHNALFDSAVWDNALKLPPAEWFDTLYPTRAAGLPGGLDKATKALFGEGKGGKDEDGKRLVDMCCDGRKQKPHHGSPVWAMLLKYNARDVEILERLYCRVVDFSKGEEGDVMGVDFAINERGIPLCRPLLERLKELYEVNSRVAGEEFGRVAPGVNAGSSKQMSEWLLKQGFRIGATKDNQFKFAVNKTVLKTFLQDPDAMYVGDEDIEAPLALVQEALEHRRDLVRAGKGKVDTALEILDDDDRVRDVLMYWGAHTGRWSSRKLQVHNLSASYFGLDAEAISQDPTWESLTEACAAASAELKRRVSVSDALTHMLRSSVRSDVLSVADYASVELRGCAWVAGAEGMLRTLADPRASVYLDMGEKVYHRKIDKSRDADEYTFAKSLVLGSTYGMSGAKFDAMCKQRDVSTSQLEGTGFKVEDAVKLFRTSYPEIPAVWKAYGAAVLEAVKRGSSARAGRCDFYVEGGDLRAQLPSGRCIVYRNARVQWVVPLYQKIYGMKETPVETVTYDNPRGYGGFLYGARVCENVVQGICRDLLAHALVRAESEGLNPVVHVHDEIVCENDCLDQLLRVMSEPPEWASGFPLMAEGYTGPVWTKHTKRPSKKAILGRVV